ncbi:hypothetical protein RSOLAG22IIIB_07586 [Rhizoctonia solani]|uniref:Uncharacterized protein n=1 Tax=Rhizoctonia solani TaxID=456999 RepID=A0A0K6FNR1_9AGAM|nr:hypothetical protein RSOLAG22IIIB_07586 [Rhizoctonia solani]
MMDSYTDESKLVSNVTQITDAALADAWVQLGMMGGVGISTWMYFTDSVISTLILVLAFSKVFVHMQPIILEIIVNMTK